MLRRVGICPAAAAAAAAAAAPSLPSAPDRPRRGVVPLRPAAQFTPQGRPRLPAGHGGARCRYTSSESRRADTSVVGRPCFSIRCSAGGFSS